MGSKEEQKCQVRDRDSHIGHNLGIIRHKVRDAEPDGGALGPGLLQSAGPRQYLEHQGGLVTEWRRALPQCWWPHGFIILLSFHLVLL